ncbi:MAG: hypothetical protein GY865_08795, partial [candidate division Zixibacteria bacterium]|nr:hypothetical protein [candidate division Zixibacteria bacterium]
MRRLRYNNWISIFTLLVVFGILLSGAHADSKKICDYCKRLITDASGVQVENKYYHKSHFICEGCSQSLVGKEFIRKNDNLLCKKCYEVKFTLKCVICGETIQGQYLQRNGQIYHKKCYDRSYGNHCSFCQKIIDGDYLTDFWGNKYHQYHENNEPFCLYCRRFISEDISKGGSVYNDGRNICGICKKTTVDNIREAEKLMSFITQKLNKYGLKIDLTNVELKLVDRNHLANLAHSR